MESFKVEESDSDSDSESDSECNECDEEERSRADDNDDRLHSDEKFRKEIKEFNECKTLKFCGLSEDSSVIACVMVLKKSLPKWKI